MATSKKQYSALNVAKRIMPYCYKCGKEVNKTTGLDPQLSLLPLFYFLLQLFYRIGLSTVLILQFLQLCS